MFATQAAGSPLEGEQTPSKHAAQNRRQPSPPPPDGNSWAHAQCQPKPLTRHPTPPKPFPSTLCSIPLLTYCDGLPCNVQSSLLRHLCTPCLAGWDVQSMHSAGAQRLHQSQVLLLSQSALQQAPQAFAAPGLGMPPRSLGSAALVLHRQQFKCEVLSTLRMLCVLLAYLGFLMLLDPVERSVGPIVGLQGPHEAQQRDAARFARRHERGRGCRGRGSPPAAAGASMVVQRETQPSCWHPAQQQLQACSSHLETSQQELCSDKDERGSGSSFPERPQPACPTHLAAAAGAAAPPTSKSSSNRAATGAGARPRPPPPTCATRR